MPDGSLTLLHGLFYYIIRDYLHEGHPDLARYDLMASMDFCERQFTSDLNNLWIATHPTLEKVQALLIGVRISKLYKEIF